MLEVSPGGGGGAHTENNNDDEDDEEVPLSSLFHSAKQGRGATVLTVPQAKSQVSWSNGHCSVFTTDLIKTEVHYDLMKIDINDLF